MRRQKTKQKAAPKAVPVVVDLTGDSSEDDDEERNNENENVMAINPQDAVELPAIKLEASLKGAPVAVEEPIIRIDNRALVFPLPVNLPFENDIRWRSFSSLGFVPLVHDCSEEHMKAVSFTLPNPIIWNEAQRNAIPTYLNGVVALPEDLASTTVLSITVDHERHAVRPMPRHTEQSSQTLPTVRVTQRLLHEVRLPVSAYAPNWCKVHTLDALQQRLNAATQLGRMLIVVCSAQNDQFWEPKVYPPPCSTQNVPFPYYFLTRFPGG